ncbi:hypothetical protein H2200_009590 [Cladophialophora chaetospira]|uniref:Heterokaryon incompatibility domain-containing protein n=1 Tax=Cladophialophora chaetospira TaxID=386627 RepID=A0AA38X2Q3_9EURO|nr:hypothetical protein H2200_009590 [Cladophialophora chaetospira]
MTSNITAFDDDKLLEAVEKATKVYKFCPNRIWAAVETSPGHEHELPILFPPQDQRLDYVFGSRRHCNTAQDTHDRCTFDFCEFSLLNFTSVQQRHESRSCADVACSPIIAENIFPEDALHNAAAEGRPTAWHLYGRRIVQPHQRFMAISHVWSDGTGAGKIQDGRVNKCLLNFFREVALELRCEGIWWDTICIPADKAARSLAIQNMQANYERAEATLVHDCFLRDLPWRDAETACLAIVMSPWWSRSWTALELARSPTVKILFKGKRGYVLKDLDDDILCNPQTQRHALLVAIIRRLRMQMITNVDDLLCVLRSRYASWTKDLALISALLVGAAVEPDDEEHVPLEHGLAAIEKAKNVYQQDIFQRVVKQIGSIEYGHLFHNLPTMSDGASWCPARLLSLPPSFSATIHLESHSQSAARADQPPALRVDSNGNVVGFWKIFSASCALPDEYDWRSVHPFIAARIRSSLKQEASHRILVEPSARSIIRALVVKALQKPFKAHSYQFIGSVHFYQPQRLLESAGAIHEITILNRLDSQGPSTSKTKPIAIKQVSTMPVLSKVPREHSDDDSDEERRGWSLQEDDPPLCDEGFRYPDGFYSRPDRLYTTRQENLQEMRWNDIASGQYGREPPWDWTPPEQQQTSQTPLDQDLLLAAKEGMKDAVLHLLHEGADPGEFDEDFRNAFSWAAINGYSEIVELLLDRHRKRLQSAYSSSHRKNNNDKDPTPVVDRWSQFFSDQFDTADVQGRTPLAWASRHGHFYVVQHLLHWYEIDIEAEDHNLWTPLTCAVMGGHTGTAKLLIDLGARIDHIDESGYSLLAVAVKIGSLATAKMLVASGVNVDGLPGKKIPIFIAAETGHGPLLRLLINGGADMYREDEYGSAVHRAARWGNVAALRLLLEAGRGRLDINKPTSFEGDTALHAAINGSSIWSTHHSFPMPKGREEVIRLLLDTERIDVNARRQDMNTPLHIAASYGDDTVLDLLLGTGRADINATNNNEETPLYFAAAYNKENAVRKLLRVGADANIRCLPTKSSAAKTPLVVAQERKYDAIVDLLKPHTSISNRIRAPFEKIWAPTATASGTRLDRYENYGL